MSVPDAKDMWQTTLENQRALVVQEMSAAKTGSREFKFRIHPDLLTELFAAGYNVTDGLTSSEHGALYWFIVYWDNKNAFWPNRKEKPEPLPEAGPA